MKVLIINKFLHPNGGSETYIFELGKQLQSMGHEVQYFGMEHEGRIVGNHARQYTSDTDFHGKGLKKLTYPFRILYSVEARKKLRIVLNDFQPDIVHLNNFNFQLTPSIIYEIRDFEAKTGHRIKIVYTAHDSQLVCPNHLMMQPDHTLCTKCVEGSSVNCMKNRCIHGSFAKSILGTLEAGLYRKNHIYRQIDTVIAPSEFLKKKLECSPDLSGRILVKHNFVGTIPKYDKKEEQPYVLYFGRYSQEKGVETLLKVCDRLPDIPFVFAGSGPLEDMVNARSNVENRGFLSGEELYHTIAQAAFCVIPSEWYENCPFSVIESQLCGTPVLATDRGGIPELLKENITGELFEAGNADDLEEKIRDWWQDKKKIQGYSKNCYQMRFATADQYCREIIEIYEES